MEFLGLEEKPEYSETDLEQAIISHLQKFLIEAGKRFCFEARQWRISFDNRHLDTGYYYRTRTIRRVKLPAGVSN